MTDPRRPFIADPAHLRVLAGQRYVVLRPSGPVEAAFDDVQRRTCERLRGLPAEYPNPHLTLAGVPGGPPEVIRERVEAWAPHVAPLTLEIERVDTFPDPWRIVIVRIARTRALAHALATLRTAAERPGLPQWPPGTIPDVESWIFHLSVAYCADLPLADWEAIAAWAGRLAVSRGRCVASDVEFVAFDDGPERLIARIPLTGH